MKRATTGRITWLLAVIVIVTACQKNSSGPGETALSKIYENGTLVSSFTYSSQNKMIREEAFDEVTGLKSYAVEFDYNTSGQLVFEKQFNASGKLTGKVAYTRAPDGKLEKHEYIPMSGVDSGQVTVRVKYSYTAEGWISKQQWVHLVTGVVESSRVISYHANGNLKASEVYYHNPAAELQWKTEYAAGDPVPANLLKLAGYPIDFRLPDFTGAIQKFYQYNNGVTVTKETSRVFSNQEYDSEGRLVKQKATLKNILPPGPAEVKEIRYEYVQL